MPRNGQSYYATIELEFGKGRAPWQWSEETQRLKTVPYYLRIYGINHCTEGFEEAVGKRVVKRLRTWKGKRVVKITVKKEPI